MLGIVIFPTLRLKSRIRIFWLVALFLWGFPVTFHKTVTFCLSNLVCWSNSLVGKIILFLYLVHVQCYIFVCSFSHSNSAVHHYLVIYIFVPLESFANFIFMLFNIYVNSTSFCAIFLTFQIVLLSINIFLVACVAYLLYFVISTFCWVLQTYKFYKSIHPIIN